MEYFFCDTGKELPETYEYLDKIEVRFGISIKRLSTRRDFDFWLERGGEYLPSPQQRWCTVNLKIKPMEQFVGNDKAYSYVGIRNDENRQGYVSFNKNIKPVYPYKSFDFVIKNRNAQITYDQKETMAKLKELGIELPVRKVGYTTEDVHELLENSGIGLPDYYRWRSRSGCYFCFFQRKYEWVMLSQEHPDLFEEAVRYEQEHQDDRRYTWNSDESLLELIARKDVIITNHLAQLEREKANPPDKPLIDELADIFGIDEHDSPKLSQNLS